MSLTNLSTATVSSEPEALLLDPVFRVLFEQHRALELPLILKLNYSLIFFWLRMVSLLSSVLALSRGPDAAKLTPVLIRKLAFALTTTAFARLTQPQLTNMAPTPPASTSTAPSNTSASTSVASTAPKSKPKKSTSAGQQQPNESSKLGMC